jgi:4-hydroxybenzoate polyprenyltransferase
MHALALSNLITYWIKLSRPRFWLYVLGPYLIGLAAAIENVDQWWRIDVWLWFVFFLLPANVFLYGINDLFDADTDNLNPQKKGKQEVVVRDSFRSSLAWVLLTIVGVTMLGALMSLPALSLWYLAGFLALGAAYSAPPLRFKSRPFIDFMSNILYVLPAGVSWAMITETPLPMLPLLVGGAWCGAMHLFSAIPDIKADKQAKLTTTAVILGKQKSLLLCSLLWLVAALGAMHVLGTIGIFAMVYVFVPLLLLGKSTSTIRRVYWYFPVLNGLFGFGLFWLVVLR